MDRPWSCKCDHVPCPLPTLTPHLAALLQLQKNKMLRMLLCSLSLAHATLHSVHVSNARIVSIDRGPHTHAT